MTRERLEATGRFLPPFWSRVLLCFLGILCAGIGMSLFLRGGSIMEVFIKLITGALIIYAAGYERKLYMDTDGVRRETSLWGKRRIDHVAWDHINDARVILNKGKKVYVIMHGTGTEAVWPLAFMPEQTEDILTLLCGCLDEGNIAIER